MYKLIEENIVQQCVFYNKLFFNFPITFVFIYIILFYNFILRCVFCKKHIDIKYISYHLLDTYIIVKVSIYNHTYEISEFVIYNTLCGIA